jgi:hypothetical protein
MATALTDVPYKDPVQACEVILSYFPEAPCAPKLTLSTRMFLEGMPCLVIDIEKRQLSLDLSREQELYDFYDSYEAGKIDSFNISPKFTPGLYTLIDILKHSSHPELKLIHIDIPGPLTFGLSFTGKNGTSAWYDETMRDIIIKTTCMKVMWIEKFIADALSAIPVMITFADPALAGYGSPFGSLNRKELQDAINEVVTAVGGVGAVHCCANIDWTLLTESKARVINFDAFRFADGLAVNGTSVVEYIEHGGMLAWGIVPSDPENIVSVDIEFLMPKMEHGIQLLVDEGIDRRLLLESSFITPCCSTALMPLELAEKAYGLTGEVSRNLRDKYL